MKNQLIKLALLGLLTNELYAYFDINRDGKVDKIEGQAYRLSSNKKIEGIYLYYDNRYNMEVFQEKYRNKKISDNVEYAIQIRGGKTYSFILKKYDKVNAKGMLEHDNIWQGNIAPLKKNAKGFKINIVPNNTGYSYSLYVNYINGKFYITRILIHQTGYDDMYTLAKKFPLPKIIDIDTFDDFMLKKKNTAEFLEMRLYGEKGFNQKLYDKMMKEW